jgi:AcrR family transcriptional regulator
MTGRSSSHLLDLHAMELTATQEQILDAAMSCISRDGIDGASMRNVAREADVSLGLLSYHFDDKRSLIVAAFELSTSRLFNASVESLVDVEGAEARVRAYIRGAFRGEFLDPQYLALRLALWAISRTDTEIEIVERHLYERYAEQMTDLIAHAQPNLSPREARDRATDVIVTQNGLWLNWARHADHDDLSRGPARCDVIALGLDTTKRRPGSSGFARNSDDGR